MNGLPPSIRRFAAPVAGAVAYFLLASGTIWLTSDGRNHAAVWVADAVILALLLSRGRARWPAILLAGWAANLAANAVMRGWTPGILFYGAINMGQVLFAAWMLARHVRSGSLLADAETLTRFILWAGIVAPVAGAAAGATVSAFSFDQPFGPSFLRWAFSNSLGLLVTTPFIGALIAGDPARCWQSGTARERAETLGLLALLGGCAWAVFFASPHPLLFVPFLPLLLIAFRSGRLAAQTGVMVVALFGALATAMDQGPLFREFGHSDDAVFALQFYLLSLSLTGLPVSAVVGARRDALAALHQRKESLKLVMANSIDGMLDYDDRGICQSAHGATEGLLGRQPQALVGTPLTALDPTMADALGNAWAQALATDTVQRLEILPPDRHGMTVEVALKAVWSDQRLVGVVATIRDISDRKAREIELARAAETDPLTGLFNRAGFDRHLQQRLASGLAPVTLALIDVDRFKSVNDSFGHQVGDDVLREIARRLKDGTRPDDLVARLGGDEFVILFACGGSAARMACERITESVARAPVHNDRGTAVLGSISCGVAPHRPEQTALDLMREADRALYTAKREGRNRVRTAA